jgi:DNA-binding transcriptional MerR regulator
MRMRELERLTGIGRETIRFYIREGLLPEPERASANSASYREEHVVRLRAIKRLQEERFLPLAIIRSLLDADDGDRWLHAGAFPDLETHLRTKLDVGDSLAVAEVAEQLGIPVDEVGRRIEDGVVVPSRDGKLGPREVAILKCIRDLDEIGFTDELGFADGGAMYAEFVKWLVGQEMRLFFDHAAGEVSDEKALGMAERGIEIINEMLKHMRTREILRQLEARRRIANDNR